MDPMPQAPPPQPNPYDFLTNPQTPQKSPIMGGGSFKSRLIIVLGGGLLLIIVAVIAISLFSAAKNANTKQLKSIYAEQQEIIRIAEIGMQNALGIDARAYVTTVALSTRTSQTKLAGIIPSKITPQEAGAKLDKKVDQALESAAASNSYDETLIQIINQRISSYDKSLRSVFNDLSSEKSRTIISDAANSSGLILKQAN